MGRYESFGACLQRVLTETGMSASEAARLVGFRSRNSIFRILNDATSCDVDERFLTALKQSLGSAWPDRHWNALETALSIKRVGFERYLNDQAFRQIMYAEEESRDYVAETRWHGGEITEIPLRTLLSEICADAEVSIVICGCCERSLTSLLASCLNDAGSTGRLTIRHYIDIHGDAAVRNILGVLPLMSKVWYNARLADEDHCPPEMAALYRVNSIGISSIRKDGTAYAHQLLQCSKDHFIHGCVPGTASQFINVMDRCRFQMERLKPMNPPLGGAEDFVDYTAQYAHLESDCLILSIKPDVHFNLVPTALLYQAVMEGFEQAEIASSEELPALLAQLQAIHDARYDNMCRKHRPTHLIYSLTAMEQFMRTGVQSDHFFIQRAYTPQERREIIRTLLQQARDNPYFNVYFLRPELPELRNEITLYEGKGVLMMDAYTGYDLHEDHSEALITLPGFMQSFHRFFMEELLTSLTLTAAESLAVLEQLLQM